MGARISHRSRIEGADSNSGHYKYNATSGLQWFDWICNGLKGLVLQFTMFVFNLYNRGIIVPVWDWFSSEPRLAVTNPKQSKLQN